MPHFTVLASGGSCVCGTLTDGEVGLGPSSSRPVAVRPRLGLGLLRRPGGCCRSPARCLAGFFLAWLACWLLSWKFTFLFSSSWVSMQGASGSTPLFSREKGRVFWRLAWRYGRCFWQRPFPYPWCFPDAGGNVSVSTFLGWFAILGILVLKSRVSRFSWSLPLLAWCLEFWVPYPVAPLPRVALWFFSSLCGARRAPSDIWPRASVSLLAFDLLLAWSLQLWGDPCLGVQWLSFRVRVLCPLLRRVDVCSSGPPLLLGWRVFTVPARSTRERF